MVRVQVSALVTQILHCTVVGLQYFIMCVISNPTFLFWYPKTLDYTQCNVAHLQSVVHDYLKLHSEELTGAEAAVYGEMNSTKVQNPRHKMQVALLAEPKTPLEYYDGFFVHTMKHCYATALYTTEESAIRYTCAYKFTARVKSRA